MRLTLRTMLAYMDDILEPGDSQEIAQKIDQSEFATTLMHRIRDVTRRLRLAAPRLEGRGMGLDPNTVAEYLDNTLPGERVPDFEKVCLESDVHLAEVAAAHQILALVLGEPADIPTSLRERVYRVAAQAEESSAVTPPPVETPAAATPATPSAAARGKAEVPEYLREAPSRRTSSGWLAIALVLLVLVGGGLFAFSQRDRLMEMLQRAGQTEVAEAPPPESAPGAAQPPAGADTTAASAPGAATPENSLPRSETTQATATDSPAGSAASSSAATGPASASATTPATGATPSTPPTPMPPALTQPTGTATPGAPAMTPPAGATEPAATASTGRGESPTAPTPPPPADTASGERLATPGATVPGGAPPLESPEGVGRYISDHQVLLQFGRQSQAWHRLAARSVVYPGDRLICLPTFRCDLAFTAGVNARLCGASEIEILPADASGIPGLRINRGRIVLLTVGRPNAQVRVWTGSRQGTIIFGDGDTTAALEVRPVLVDGENPEEAQAPIQADLYATSGKVFWSDGTRPEPEAIDAPAHRSLSSAAPAGPMALGAQVTIPVWVSGDDRTELDRKASPIFDENLPDARPITLGLKELAADRRIEVSSLAARCLVMVGEYDAAIAMLNDQAHRSNWNDLVDSLRSAMADSIKSATAVRAAWEKNRVAKGPELFRLLWSFSPQQLAAGEAARLVALLDNEDLDFRVLSFWNLYRITGSSLFYRPEYVGAKRQQYVVKWQQKLNNGELAPKTP